MREALDAMAFAACLSLALACETVGGAAPVAPAAERRDWSEPPDFAALRAEYGARDDFDARCEVDRPLRRAYGQMQAEAWSDLLALAEPWAQRCPVDLEAHMLCAIALEQSGRTEEADAHRSWVRGLFESVLATGDGKTPETAYRVIAVFEEYAMLRMFRWEPKQQALVAQGIDAMTVDAEGEERVVYFDPAASFARMRKQFEARAQE
ncbi:MAG TPA: DUF4919 domain-containing protein [Myxococcota bacterium]|jgi:hypothetical protein